jgi:hypothetical protein
MLDTVREFVAERLAARPDVAEIERRHADHYSDAGRAGRRQPRRVDQNQWAERLQVEAGNLAAAVRWYLAHDPAPLPHLFRVLVLFWFLQDHLGEARSWVDQVHASVPDGDVVRLPALQRRPVIVGRSRSPCAATMGRSTSAARSSTGGAASATSACAGGPSGPTAPSRGSGQPS